MNGKSLSMWAGGSMMLSMYLYDLYNAITVVKAPWWIIWTNWHAVISPLIALTLNLPGGPLGESFPGLGVAGFHAAFISMVTNLTSENKDQPDYSLNFLWRIHIGAMTFYYGVLGMIALAVITYGCCSCSIYLLGHLKEKIVGWYHHLVDGYEEIIPSSPNNIAIAEEV